MKNELKNRGLINSKVADALDLVPYSIGDDIREIADAAFSYANDDTRVIAYGIVTKTARMLVHTLYRSTRYIDDPGLARQSRQDYGDEDEGDVLVALRVVANEIAYEIGGVQRPAYVEET